MKEKGKRGIAMDFMGWLIIGISVLVVMLIGIFILKDKGMGAIDYLNNLFRFGR